MKYFVLFILPISFLLGCNDSDDDSDPSSKTCSENPLENIEWLKELVNNTNANGLEIIQYDYKVQTVFSINSCLGCSDNLIIIYDCEKNKVCKFGGISGLNSCPDFDTEAKNETLLFSTRNCDKGTIISPKLYKALKTSPITSVKIEGDCLLITFNILSSQNNINDTTLIDSGEILESSPVQRRLKFNIKENRTRPTSVIATTSFNISNLANEDETITLIIDGFDHSIDYTRSTP
ncbi:hypothetical protein [uncultured Algibacter sp.]|uniref:DUF6970 domain-containing protein n=1 Tax=uncultured Algibacter sp. TaxID=298659 RepID=UPI003217BFDE